MMKQLARALLESVSGGNGGQCTLDDPAGTRSQTYVTNVRDANGRILTDWNEIQQNSRSTAQRVIDATDRALRPWQIFNGIFGGLAFDAPRPNYPAPQRPR